MAATPVILRPAAVKPVTGSLKVKVTLKGAAVVGGGRVDVDHRLDIVGPDGHRDGRQIAVTPPCRWPHPWATFSTASVLPSAGVMVAV